MVGEGGVATIFRVFGEKVEVAVFVGFSGNVEVAVFIVAAVVAIKAVLAVHNVDS